MLHTPDHLVSEISDSVGLLISILVRYPEVATINYDPKANLMRFTFILKTGELKQSLDDFKHRITTHLAVYHNMEHKRVETLEIAEHSYEEFSMLDITRDVKSLSQEEIALIDSLVTDYFGSVLISESNDSMLEDELVMQEELIGHMLASLKGSTQDKNLIAFREEGKVLVFNK